MLELDIELRRGTFQRHVRIKDDARVIALVGPSGAGKTSVLNAIAGLVTPVAGRIDVDGRSLFDSTRGIDVPVHRRRVGYVFQDARLFPHLDVRRNLLYGRHGGHGAPRFGFDAVVDLLGIAPLLARRTRNLSGGEAQRVAIGRALLSQPSMLLTWLLSAGIVVLILMTPTVLQTAYGFAPAQTLEANSLAIVFLSLGCVLAGMLADRFGAGRVFILGSLLLAAVTWSFYSNLKAHPDWLLPLYALTGLGVGMIGAVPYVLVKAFPAAVRFSGLSFSYNLAYAIFGGLTPMVVAFLLKFSPMGPAYYVMALCGLGLLIGLYLFSQRR